MRPSATYRAAISLIYRCQQDIVLADLIRYHVNVYWENAPDRRTSRTPDWLNDACEARINKKERHHGRVTYAALMSPLSIGFDNLSFDLKHPLAHANRAKLRLSKRQYTGGFPISLLVVAAKPGTAGAGGATQQTEPHALLLGMKKRLGRRAVVRKCMGAEIKRHPDQDEFMCRIKVGTGTIDVGFATKFEVDTLFKYLNLSSEPGAAPTGAWNTP